MVWTSPGHAQMEKGKWIAGVRFSYGTNSFESTQTNRDQKTSSTDIGLSVGKLVSRNLCISAGYSVMNNFSSSTYSSDNYYKSYLISNSFAISVSNYALVEKNFFYNPGAYVSFTASKGEFKTKQPGFQELTNTNNSNGFSIAAYPIHFGYLLKNKFLFSAGFGEIKYTYINSDSDLATNNDAVGKSHGFSVSFIPNVSNVGVSFIF